MALDVKDAGDNTVTLKTTFLSSEHTTHHIIDNTGFDADVTTAIYSGLTGASIAGVEMVYVGGIAPGSILQPISVDATGGVTVGAITPSSTVVQANTTIAADDTAEQMAAVSVTRGVHLRARASNTNIIYIGTSSSVNAANGFALEAGESVYLEIDNLENLWVFGKQNDVLGALGS